MMMMMIIDWIERDFTWIENGVAGEGRHVGQAWMVGSLFSGKGKWLPQCAWVKVVVKEKCTGVGRGLMCNLNEKWRFQKEKPIRSLNNAMLHIEEDQAGACRNSTEC